MPQPASPLIWALDVATVTGFARGRISEKPTAEAIRLAPSGASSDELFHGCLAWFGSVLRESSPDILALEELLPPIARRGATSTAAQHRLAGLHGIIRALAQQAQVPEVIAVNVLDVRAHFIHDRRLPREEAKRAVLKTCRLLGWSADDTDCADALATWSYTCALIDPKTAVRTTPLFGSWDEVARKREAKRG